jgi:hypothetical protein
MLAPAPDHRSALARLPRWHSGLGPVNQYRQPLSALRPRGGPGHCPIVVEGGIDLPKGENLFEPPAGGPLGGDGIGYKPHPVVFRPV